MLKNLGAALLLSQQELSRLISSAPHRYKTYLIEKRNRGQYRTIAQPAKEVKALQYWVIQNVLNMFHVHPAAIGYQRGKNIADNARSHVNSRFLLKLDFKDFFPSIRSADFDLYIRKQQIQITDQEVAALSRILFWNPKGTKDMCLAIGAPSSPGLSNILMFEFDSAVEAFCSEAGVSYTRYADDLSFSANLSDELRRVEEWVTHLCDNLESPRLSLNREKTVRVSKKRARRVTGLVLTNDSKVSIGRDQKRRIRASVHHFATGRLPEDQSRKLRGLLAYINSVEPSFLNRLRHKYGADTIKRLQSAT
ncbi:MAG: hypothetical protein A3J28_02565 [Acidobacteria bacterium RIFCSPLOWO2_12_FULL_60_22]|nr:MAG: hypothetical protein A3J28_02565 [Acidobacteria bacterium RIFCSPLOWO2_12_FULL_60_22]